MLKKSIPIHSYSGEYSKNNTTNKKALARDFNHRCAYCDDLDAVAGGFKSYHVEHFAPKKKFPSLKYTYENLLYACPFCNNAKSEDWPSESPDKNIVGNTGYVKPCDPKYAEHLDRDEKGKIFFKTDLGEYMYNHLKLYLRRHEIIFMLDLLKVKRDHLEVMINKEKLEGKDYSKKEAILNSLDKEFFNYYTQFLSVQSE